MNGLNLQVVHMREHLCAYTSRVDLTDGAELKQRMHAAGYNNRTLAAALGVSIKAVSNWVNERNVPQGPNLIALERLLTQSTGDTAEHERLARELPTHVLFSEVVRRLMTGVSDASQTPQGPALDPDMEPLHLTDEAFDTATGGDKTPGQDVTDGSRTAT